MHGTILLAGILSFVSAFLGGVLAVGVVVPPLVDAQAARIRAEQFTLVDAAGVDRVSLQTGPGESARLAVMNPDGAMRAIVATGGRAGAFSDAVGFTLHDAQGVTLGRFGSGNPRDEGAVANLRLSDRQGRDRVVVAVLDDETPSIRLLDGAGNVTWSAP